MAKRKKCPLMTINGNKLGLALGFTFAIIHFAWAITVKLGLAAKFIDWVLMLRFIRVPISLAPFSIGNAVFLIICTFISGYVIGWLFAAVYHCVEHKCKF